MEVSFEYVKGKGYVTTVADRDNISIRDHTDSTKAFSPTELLALGMSGCSSSDVLSILEKKQQNVAKYRCSVNYDKETEHPKVLKNPVIHYEFWGEVDPEAAKRSVFLSLSKYCNVTITVIRAGINVGYKISINDRVVEEGPAPKQ